MLAIRMQRTGRKGHANFRIVVQDSRKSPKSGKVVALLGSYDPHAKTSVLDKERAAHFLTHGAQPSDRVAVLLKSEGVKLPKWVAVNDKKSKALRNPEKLRKNRPAEAAASEETPEAPAETVTEAPAEENAGTQEAKTPEAETIVQADTNEEPKTEENPESSAEPAETDSKPAESAA